MTSLTRLTRSRALLLSVVILLAPLTACGDDDDTAGDDTTTTTADTTTTSDTTTTTTPTADAPEEIAAVLGDGRLVMLDAETGDVARTLLEGIAVDDPAKNGIAIDPDGEYVYVVRPGPVGEDVDNELVRISPDGGQPELIAMGRAPSVSPDGSTLAYTDAETLDLPPPAPFIVLRDLETGDERELRRQDQDQFHFIAETEWTDDGARVAFVAGEIKTGLFVFDADADDLDGAERVGPDVAADDDTSWHGIAPLPDGRLAVAEWCCDIPDRERWTVIAVDVDSGDTEEGLLPEERVEASRIDSDPTARHLLLITDSDIGGGSLVRWSLPDDGDPGELETLREDVVVAAW